MTKGIDFPSLRTVVPLLCDLGGSFCRFWAYNGSCVRKQDNMIRFFGNSGSCVRLTSIFNTAFTLITIHSYQGPHSFHQYSLHLQYFLLLDPVKLVQLILPSKLVEGHLKRFQLVEHRRWHIFD
jgi:hypothetical protein